jgi:hypothetical protein
MHRVCQRAGALLGSGIVRVAVKAPPCIGAWPFVLQFSRLTTIRWCVVRGLFQALSLYAA